MTRHIAAAAALLILVSCALPSRPVSPTSRYGQVSLTLHTNATHSEGNVWPTLVIRSVLTKERFRLRRQPAAVVRSVHYSGRVPPGRYEILGLLSSTAATAKKLSLSKSLGNFDVQVNKHCQLGEVLHWQHKNLPSQTLRRAAQSPCWNEDGLDVSRRRAFAQRGRALIDPAMLSSGPVIRSAGFVSYRTNQGRRWQLIDSGAVHVTAAVELDSNELLLGGENGLLLYAANGKLQPLPLKPNNAVVLALLKTKQQLLMLISTQNALQLLSTRNIFDEPWRLLKASDHGYKKTPPDSIRASLLGDRLSVETTRGKLLFSTNL